MDALWQAFVHHGKAGMLELSIRQSIMDAIDSIPLAALGLASPPNEALPKKLSLEEIEAGFSPGDSVKAIRYVHVKSCDQVSAGIFIIPAGSTIPLHDHRDMVVLMRILYGQMYLRSFDITEDDRNKLYEQKTPTPWQVLRARVTYGDVLNVGTHAVLPDQGNLHILHALSTTAILDVNFPPYDESRPCLYFQQLGVGTPIVPRRDTMASRLLASMNCDPGDDPDDDDAGDDVPALAVDYSEDLAQLPPGYALLQQLPGPPDFYYCISLRYTGITIKDPPSSTSEEST